ncbi:hypothetical protein LEP48_08615 [Isoptericola sp. NEAU-Y5]|uniref:Nucleoside 2-deoxyribosyltransferase n=1 Tax=Isoptericola luteus TaxID=2879484 RepID=A0ABS7ZG12_9MICO|nr:hypothetical protein [Isoptericola sp. NEAU-Y5]MCA5893412.1 hypothetical protein [Isoptericola sp. NEAU-Y5]
MSDETKKAFFVSPIGKAGSSERERSDKVLEFVLRPALVPKVVSKIVRADDDSNPGEITPALISSILESDLIIADLTGSNPNVYYEVALAHAFKKPVVHIRLDTPDAIPFDIKDVRVFSYSFDIADAQKAIQDVGSAARHAIDNPASIVTPVDRGQLIAQGATSSDLTKRTNAEILDRLERIDSRLSNLNIALPGSSPGVSSTERDVLDLIRMIGDLEGHGDFDSAADLAMFQSQARRELHARLENAINQEASRIRHPSRAAKMEASIRGEGEVEVRE